MDGPRVGREICGDFPLAEAREWLVTNGRGGYASGTVAGSLSRRYHGLLIAALAPPVDRRLLVAKCEIDVTIEGVRYALGSNRWASGAIAPSGHRLIESFELVDTLPTWMHACGDVLIEQTIAMPHGADATALALRLVRARTPIEVRLRVLFADRDHHGGELPELAAFRVDVPTGLDVATIALPACGRTLTVTAPGARITPSAQRYAGFALVREAERGLAASDDYAHLLDIEFTLDVGDRAGCVVTLDPSVPRSAHAIVATRRERERARARMHPLAPIADAFVVARAEGTSSGSTVIAGYPWFADWGRDTMIALPGLTLAVGRPEIAREILTTFAATVDGGMLPNRFPDDGAAPEYNTVDAALWYIEAVRAYVTATDDVTLLAEVFPALNAIVEGYTNGTRYGIVVDEDGLVRAGIPGVQLTWMDAKVGDWVVTPRIGKPIEISALWYAGMRAMEVFADKLERPSAPYRLLAERCANGFARFWNSARGYCYDVLDGPDGHDAALRPNQLFACSLHASPLDDARARAVVDACSRELVTSYGLRTLAPSEPAYRGRYGGDQAARDAAYHQGTVWPWLIGPFVRAHLRVYRDLAVARTFVRPLLDARLAYGVGMLAEIFEGDAPHAPCGTIAQAWSIAALIDALAQTEMSA